MSEEPWVAVDAWETASFLADKITVGHPFSDGIKRCAWATCATMLRMHGYQLALSPETGLALVLGLVLHTSTYQDLAVILRTGLCEEVA